MKRVFSRRQVTVWFVVSLVLILLVAGCTLFPHKDKDPANLLRPGEVLEGIDGVSVGAPDGALEDEIEVFIQKEDDPTDDVPLPEFLEGVEILGSFYSVGSSKNFFTPEGNYLILGLPVPEGESPDDLAFLILSPPGSVITVYPEDDDPSIRWNPVRGAFDPESGLFGTILPFIGTEPEIFVLARGVGYEDVEVEEESVLLPSFFNINDFRVRSVGFSTGESPLAHRQATRNALRDAHDAFVATQGFSKPRLRVVITGISFWPPKFLFTLRYEYELRKGSVNGAYVPSQQIAYTRYPGLPSTPDSIIARHELFHSIQFAYSEIRKDWDDRKSVWGVLEGTAVASELHMMNLQRSNTTFNGRQPMPVTTSMFSNVLPSGATAIAYRTQDFWVFIGKRMNVVNPSIGFVIPLFERGSLRSDIDQMIKDDGTFESLGDAYWQWAKNQSFEKETILGIDEDGLSVPHGDPCEWSGHGTAPTIIKVDPEEDGWGDVTRTFSLTPLTSRVYEVNMIEASIEYAAVANIESASPDVQFKFYEKKGPDTCNSWENVQATFTVSGDDITAFALVSNTNMNSSVSGITLRISLSEGPVVTKISGPSGTIFESSRTFVWSGTANPGSTIQRYEYRRDGGAWINHGLTTSFTWSGYSEGTHTFEVRARDTKGLYSEPVKWTFNYDAGYFKHVVAVDGGRSHTLALRADGTVWAWGSNESGQLGDGTWDDSLIPVQVGGKKGLANIVAIAAGYDHSVALRKDGTVWTWGSNEFGQLGDGTDTNAGLPVQVLGRDGKGLLEDAIAIAAGGEHTLALISTGITHMIQEVLAWGLNESGQLGDGSWDNSLLPVIVGGKVPLNNVMAISAGNMHSVALTTDGRVWTWGDNKFGQLGILVFGDARNFPDKVVGPGGKGELVGIEAIAAGGWHTLALQYSLKGQITSVWSWGFNGTGQLGDDTLVNKAYPVQVRGQGGEGFLGGIVRIAAGHDHSLALKEEMTVLSWGSNKVGQLGDGTNDDRRTPVQVGTKKNPLTGIMAIGAGAGHSAAVKTAREEGRVWTWGLNHSGQLGDGTKTSRNLPVGVKRF